MERRHLTVLFCDLVGSTELSTLLDPEALADVILLYRTVMQTRVAANGGTVAQYVGDGVLAYFGYPFAREDDAVRAVGAALGMIDEMPTLNTRLANRLRTPLQVRIGVHSGLTVIEAQDVSGAGLHTMGAIGQVPNIAARLQDMATPGTALVSGTTHALTAMDFDFATRGIAQLKGVAAPVPIFSPLRARASRGRRGPRLSQDADGHPKEFERLHGLWAGMVAGNGTSVLLTGDPGIGKSYVSDRLIAQAVGDGGFVMEFKCQADAAQSPFRIVVAGLRRWIVGRGGNPVLSRLDTFVGSGREAPSLKALLCEFLSLPPPPDATMPALTREGRLQFLRDMLIQRLGELSGRQPVLVSIENVHWIDPSSRDWLAELARQAGRQRLLVLATSRTIAGYGGGTEPFAHHVRIERLDGGSQERLLRGLERAAMVAGLLPSGQSLPTALRQAVLDRSDGVPLFIEELFKTVIEAGAEADTTPARAQRTGDGDAIPGSLRAMLTARLDRLGGAKRIALAASVIGREFTLDLLASLRATPPRELEPGLALLVGAGIVRRQDRPASGFIFKHALLRDAAYDSLLAGERQALHAKLADTYVKQAPEIMQAHPEIVAHHASIGNQVARATSLWTQAGQRALDRSSYREAGAHLRRAMGDAERLPEPLTPQQAARLNIDLATATTRAEGYAAPDAEKLSLKAYDICITHADRTSLTDAISGLTNYYMVRGPLSSACRLAGQLVDLALEEQDEDQLIRATRRLGWCRFCMGDIDEGRQILADALIRYNQRQRVGRLHEREIDSGVIGYANLAWVESFAGDAARGIEYCNAGQALAVSLGGRPADMAYAVCMSAATHLLLGNHGAALALAGQAHEIASRNALPYWQAWSMILRGAALAATDPNQGVRPIMRGLHAYRALGARLFLPYSLGLAAQTVHALNRPRMALMLLDRATQEMAVTGARFSEAGLMAMRARLLLDAGRDQEAAEEAMRARQLARRQGALLFAGPTAADTLAMP